MNEKFYEEIDEILEKIKKLKAIIYPESVINKLKKGEPLSGFELMQLKFELEDELIELDPIKDGNLPSAIIVVDLESLSIIFDGCENLDKNERFQLFNIWFGYIYPKTQIFALEVGHVTPLNKTEYSEYTAFEIYLTPQNIKNLIKILKKGLEYLKKYGEKDK